ncbi:hypothetical protein ACFLWK_00070 [Chloroflexota bacterium]
MTAEIVVMNKEAVALAADSAITAGIGEDSKIFTTADKIFPLSQNKPICVMVYSNAQFVGVPWETIICDIGRQIPIDGFNTLEEYTKQLLAYFEKECYLFPQDEQETHFSYLVYDYFTDLVRKIVEAVGVELEKRGSLNERASKLIISKVIRNDLNEWIEIAEGETCSSISLDMSAKIIRYYRNTILEDIKNIFQKIPISRQGKRNLFKILRHLISYGSSDDINTGVVIAGFGEREAFPSVKSFTFNGLYNCKLKFFRGADRAVGKDTEAGVIAFAQREMVSRFMEGVDPEYREAEKKFMTELSEKLPKVIIKKLKKYKAKERKKLLAEMRNICNAVFEEYREGMDREVEKYFTDPITEVVAVLPKSELASLAESLVSLTSIKRKFSRESETVSEPIDVAVISKRNGFVWIKKK